jgi:hypothetical protein
MTDLERLASRLPVHRFSKREMYLCKLKMRVRDVYELHWPIIYMYARKILKFVGVEL